MIVLKGADDKSSVVTEQCIIIRFLVNEDVRPAEVLRRITTQFGNQTKRRD